MQDDEIYPVDRYLRSWVTVRRQTSGVISLALNERLHGSCANGSRPLGCHTLVVRGPADPADGHGPTLQLKG